MTKITRKRIWPVSLVATLGVIAMLAILAAVMWPTGAAQAQGLPPAFPPGKPTGLTATVDGATQISLSWTHVGLAADRYDVERKSGGGAFANVGMPTTTSFMDSGLTASTDYIYRVRAVNAAGDGSWSDEMTGTTMVAGTPGTTTPTGTMLESSSTSGGVGIQLTLTIVAAGMEDLHAGDRIEIYLEDDYSVPDSISTSDVYFRVPGGSVGQNNGGRVNAADVSIDDSDHFTPDKDDWAIAILVPDMDPRDDEFGYPVGNQDLVVVIEKDAGIKNPTEQGTHSNGYSILTGGESDNDGPEVTLDVLNTWAKISLSASDGGRGKEVTVTGSGFNNGTEAEVFVLVAPAVDEDATPAVMAPSCETIVDDGDSLGTAGVGSDDKFAVAFTVHQDEFDAGKVNYICAVDSEAGDPRLAMAVKTFDLTASVSIDPTSAASGEEVTLKARDFGGPLTEISLGADHTWTNNDVDDDHFKVKEIDKDDYTFDLPGGLSKSIQVAAKRVVDGKTTRKTTSLSVTPSSLSLSSTEVVPNETIIISGKGFSEDKKIMVSEIKIDGKALVVDEAGTEGSGSSRYVETTSDGEFTVTVTVWHDGAGNPALDDDEYTIKVTDETGFEGKATITIKEPTVSVSPKIASPRDYITISGENWPASNSDDDNEVNIEVDGKNRSANIDSTGRFNYQYQLSAGIGIGDEHDVVVTFDDGDGGDIEEETTFAVPSSNVTITPAAAAPGEMISLEITGMPIYEKVDRVVIDGGNRLSGSANNTDSEGNVMITGILIPYADPGFYPVRIDIGNETAVVQLEILAEPRAAGVAAALPGALEDLSDNLVVVWHFNTTSKVWTFYDPRPEAAEFNTLTELAGGQAYQVLVSADVTNVVLNGKTRNLTCSGDNCWNQLVW